MTGKGFLEWENTALFSIGGSCVSRVSGVLFLYRCQSLPIMPDTWMECPQHHLHSQKTGMLPYVLPFGDLDPSCTASDFSGSNSQKWKATQ